MVRLIPGKTKVQIELFKGVRLADVLVGLVTFLMIVFVVISSLPYKFYIVLGLLCLAVLLLVRLDTVPTYTYLLNMLRHFAYHRKYRRSKTDEQLLHPQESKKKSFSKAFQKKEGASKEEKERKRQIQEENRILASKDVSEEEKEKIRQRRKEEAKLAA